jgi:hypothetical protein
MTLEINLLSFSPDLAVLLTEKVFFVYGRISSNGKKFCDILPHA